MGKKIFIKKLSDLILLLDFDEEVKEDALKYISNRYGFISKVSEKVYSLNSSGELISEKNCHTRLMILIFKIVHLREMYMAKGISEKVMLDTLSDLVIRQKMFMKNHGRIGITSSDAIWLKHIYNLQIFKLGTLQFEMANMQRLDWKGATYHEGAFEKVSKGAPILNVHIRRGVDFSRKQVDKSFIIAEDFFTKFFPEHDFVAYTCNSWMLSQKNNKLLPANSNILDFAKRFNIIGYTDNNEFTLEYIFGKRYRSKSEYPQNTKLQINALKNINKLGAGFGFIYRKRKIQQRNLSLKTDDK